MRAGFAEELRRGCQTITSCGKSRIIFYYGVRSIPRPWSLVREELDEHFGYPVTEKVEQANEYFRSKLFALLQTP